MTQRAQPHRLVLALLAAGVMVLGAPGSATAQLGLPEEISRAVQLTPEQQAEVKRYVESKHPNLKAEQTRTIQRARADLEAPLRLANVSVDFRQRYTDALVPNLKPLSADKRDEVAINALRLAGELGTKQGIDLLDAALADKRQGVRFMAASSYQAAFRAARDAQPALSNLQAMSVLSTLERAVNAETDPMVLDGLFISLDAATEVPPERLEGVRDRAAEIIAAGAGQIVRKQQPNTVAYGPIKRAGKTLFDLLGNPNIKLTNKALVESGGYAGDVLCLALRRLGAALPADSPERSELALTAGQAMRVQFFAHTNLGGEPSDARLDELISTGKDDRFREEAAKFIGPAGVLTAAPFNLPANRFACAIAAANANPPAPAAPANP